MSGLNICCGSFSGERKSGSALHGVLDALVDAPRELIEELKHAMDESDYMLITEDQAKLLLPLLVNYQQHLITEIGNDDWEGEAAAEEMAGFDYYRDGEEASRGWRLYCAMNLIPACETALVEHQPVVIYLA